MGYPRSMTVDPEAPGFYHCISRCVRRAWLCGEDPVSGRNFDHRRAWIERRLVDLAESFAVSLFAWAVMSNHTHVVLRIDPGVPEHWSDEEVARRWARLTRTLAPLHSDEHARRMRVLLMQPERLVELRRRLGSLSWFMRFLNEAVAREANAEDVCTGRFWEGRYKCQALVDEAAVLACMAYVDLNPIRAGTARGLEDSDFTSVQRRLRQPGRDEGAARAALEPLVGESAESPAMTIPAYLDLLRWTADRLVPVPPTRELPSRPEPAVPARASPDWWVGCVFRIEQVFGSAVGLPSALQDFAAATGRRRLRGLVRASGSAARAQFSPG
jgi:REP element-mobilizing transposase RayT